MTITDPMFAETIEYIKQKHGSQERKFSLAPYYTHSIRVACLVMKYKESHEIDNLVIAALLHDVVEDTDVTSEEIEAKYGILVRSLVDELTSSEVGITLLGKTEYLKRHVCEMSSWALVIKLCDRLDNVSDFIYAPEKFRKKYTLETLEIILELRKNYELSDTHYAIIRDIERMMSIF